MLAHPGVTSARAAWAPLRRRSCRLTRFSGQSPAAGIAGDTNSTGAHRTLMEAMRCLSSRETPGYQEQAQKSILPVTTRRLDKERLHRTTFSGSPQPSHRKMNTRAQGTKRFPKSVLRYYARVSTTSSNEHRRSHISCEEAPVAAVKAEPRGIAIRVMPEAN